MDITERYKGYSGVEYIFEYHDADSFEHLPYEECRQAYGVCFYEDKLLIGFGGKKLGWGLVGGTIEEGESFLDTLKREIIEESNMEVVSAIPIGYQKTIDVRDNSYVYQLRYVCKVIPLGPFECDPAGGITEIKLIEPERYKEYFNWGKIGERLIQRALERKDLI